MTTDTIADAVLLVPPAQEHDAEMAVLGAMLLDVAAMRFGVMHGTASHFADPAHRALFEIVCETMSALEPDEAVDIVTIEAAAKAAGEYDGIGGREALMALVDSCPTVLNHRAYWRLLDNALASREVREAAIETLRAGGEGTAATADLPLTDLGNAARFVRAAGGKARFVGGWGRWIAWRSGRWKRDDDFTVLKVAAKAARRIYDEAKTADDLRQQDALGKWAMRAQSRERLTAMVDLARPDLAVDVDDLDADAFAFNVRNGTLDLRTGKLRPHRPADLITHRANVAFDPAATCPLFLAFLDRIMDGDAALVAYLQRLFGMTLTADVSEQALWIFHGDGANGKSTLQDTIVGLMGDYAGEAPPDLLLTRSHSEHPTEVADLCGRRLVMASEADEGRRLRVQLVKRLTGNARLKARYMRGDYFEFSRTHKMVLAANSKPVIKEATRAIWRRIRLVPFGVVIPPDEQDRHLGEKLAKERPGILNWCLAGCLAWQRDGLGEPAEVLAATAGYEAEQDILGDFFADACTFGPHLSATRTDLYAAYRQHAEHARDRNPLDRTAFYDRVRRRPAVEDAPPRRIGGKVTRFFAGIGLLVEERVGHDA